MFGKQKFHTLFFFGGGAKNLNVLFDQFSRHFTSFRTTLIFSYFPGWVVGWVGGWLSGWVGEIKNKANLSPAELPAKLELGLSLVIYTRKDKETQPWKSFQFIRTSFLLNEALMKH